MGCFAFTPPSRMIASVMRGTDKSGRMFIAIRTKNKNPYKLNKMIKLPYELNPPEKFSILYKYHTDGESWSKVENNLFSNSDKGSRSTLFIENGRYDPEHILALNTLITTGKCECTRNSDGTKEVVELV